jgi:hypothetical protein
MKMVRRVSGGMPLRHECEEGDLPRGTGTLPADFILDIESIDGNTIRFAKPLPEWVKPGVEVWIVD